MEQLKLVLHLYTAKTLVDNERAIIFELLNSRIDIASLEITVAGGKTWYKCYTHTAAGSTTPLHTICHVGSDTWGGKWSTRKIQVAMCLEFLTNAVDVCVSVSWCTVPYARVVRRTKTDICYLYDSWIGVPLTLYKKLQHSIDLPSGSQGVHGIRSSEIPLVKVVCESTVRATVVEVYWRHECSIFPRGSSLYYASSICKLAGSEVEVVAYTSGNSNVGGWLHNGVSD